MEIGLKTYTLFGHKFVKKLVCVKPGSCQPTVRAGAPTKVQINKETHHETTLYTIN